MPSYSPKTTLRRCEQELREMMYDDGLGHTSVFRPETIVHQRFIPDDPLAFIPSARIQTL